MAAFNAITTDLTGLGNTLKIVYDKKAIRNLLGINSPLLRMIKKERVEGISWNWPVLYSQSPAVAADFTVAQGLITTMNAQQIAVTPGMLWAPYNTTAAEIKAGATAVGAFPPTPPALLVRHFAATDSFRKALDVCAYGSGFGEIGTVQSSLSNAATTMVILNNTRAALGLGYQFQFTNNANGLPSDPIVSGGPYTVTGFTAGSTAGQSIMTFSPGVTNGPIAQGAWIVMQGFRASATSTSPYGPLGLGAWVPTYGNRTTAGFTSYIATPLFGLTRNTDISRLAGGFYLAQQNGEKRIDGLLEALRVVRDQGGEANMVIANSITVKKVMQELTGSLTYFQQTSGGSKGDPNDATRGFREMEINFLDSQAKIVADPFCPLDVAYVMPREIFAIRSYTNSETPTQETGVPEGDKEGTMDIADVDIPPEDYKFLTNDYITVQPGTAIAYGPQLQIIVQFVGNYTLDNPAHVCVVAGLI